MPSDDDSRPFVVLASRCIKNITAEEAEHLRKAMQTIYGAWAGSMVAAGRSDEEIALVLKSSLMVLDIHDNPLLAAVARTLKTATKPAALKLMRGNIPT